MTKMKITWILKIIASIILLQTLFYKFTAAPESIYIFSTLKMEPYGRIGIGISELIVAVLILIPKTTLMGSLAGVAIMAGAIVSHLFVLGIQIQNDKGFLFTLAIITLFCCLGLVYLNKDKISTILKSK